MHCRVFRRSCLRVSYEHGAYSVCVCFFFPRELGLPLYLALVCTFSRESVGVEALVRHHRLFLAFGIGMVVGVDVSLLRFCWFERRGRSLLLSAHGEHVWNFSPRSLFLCM